jgi:dipeptidyl aminopeptidase/acylaminoacyl peptidase
LSGGGSTGYNLVMPRFALVAVFLPLLAAGCPSAPKPPTAPAALAPAPPAAPLAPADEPTAPPPAPADHRTLVLEGTPEIPQTLRERMNQYQNTRSASLSAMSDDGGAILITTRFGETAQIHLVDRPMGARKQLTFAAEPAHGAIFVPGTTGSFLFSADVGGDERHQIYRVELDGGRTTRLTDGNSRNGSYLWARDGKRLAYASNARNQRDFDIWLSDGHTAGIGDLLVEGEGWYYPIDWSRDGKQLLVGRHISANESQLYLVDVASRGKRLLTPPAPKAAYRGACFASNGQRAYIASDREGEFLELYEVDLAGGTWKPLTRAIPWDVESLALSPSGRTLAFTVNEGGISSLRLLDTATRKIRTASNVPKGIITGLQFAGKADVLGFSFASATRSGDAYTYDVKAGRITRWTESELGGLDPATFVEPELISYPSFDEKQIPAFLYKPVGSGPFPVIINIHGGPESQSRPVFSPLTQFLVVESGFAVVYPNVRGSSGYGKSYLLLDNGYRREDSVKDIGALLDFIGERPDLDQANVGVLGGSYGGYMVLASLVHFGQRIRAGADVVGISNFVTFLENTADYRRDLRRVEYGDERDPKMREHLEAISPLGRVEAIKSALFVAQGANDPRVPASEAQQIVDAVRASGQDVWYMLARNEGHGFARKENRDTHTLLTVLFFEKHLAPHQPPPAQ